MQLHCLAEPKLERESIIVVYDAFVTFGFDEGFLYFIKSEVREMEEGISMNSKGKNIFIINSEDTVCFTSISLKWK